MNKLCRELVEMLWGVIVNIALIGFVFYAILDGAGVWR